MENTKLAKLANYEKSKTWCAKSGQLTQALNTLRDVLGMDYGSITIRFHDGKWMPKLEIEKRVMEDVKE